MDDTSVPGMIEAGNIDMNTRPRVKNPNGSISTVRSIGVNVNGQEVLIPTVSDDGRIMDDQEAIQHFKQTGRHLGKFADPKSSDAYAQQLHESEAKKLEQPTGYADGGTVGKVDYSKLSNDALEQIASGKPVDYSKLSDDDLHVIASTPMPTKPKPEPQISGLTAAELGVRNLAGAGPIAAGAAQAIPDKIMQWLSGPTPSLEGKSPMEIQQALKGKSPTQVDAALKSLGVKGDIGPTSSSELYNQAKEANEAPLHLAEKQHPILTGAGKLGGDLLMWEGLGALSPQMVAPEGAGIAKRVLAHGVNGFLPGAGIGALESNGKVVGGTPDQIMQVGKDAVKGGLTGSALGMGLGLVAEGAGALAGSKTAQDIKGYYNIGKEGQDLSKESAQIGGLNSPELLDPVSLHDTQAATDVLANINKIDEHLGQEVGATIKQSTEMGTIIKADENAAKQIDEVFNTGKTADALGKDSDLIPDEDQFDNTKLKKYFDYANKYKTQGLTPAETQEFRNELGNLQRRINYTDPYLAADIRGLVTKLTTDLKTSVRGYEDAADRLNNFRREIPETILSKDNPADVTRLRMSGVRNVDTRLVNQLKSVIRGLNDPSNVTARGSYTNLLQGMQRFHTKELMRQASTGLPTAFEGAGVPPEAIESSIKTAATKSKLLQDYTGTNLDPLTVLKNPTKLLTRPANWAANKAGVMRSGENAVLNTGKKLYSASNEALEELANKLDQIPSQKPMANALRKAVQDKNPTSKNAILFSLMQNPDSRRLIQSGEFYVGAGE